VRMKAAENPNLPIEILLRFSLDPEEYIRRGVAANIVTPVGLLETLADDVFYMVRMAVASNPNTPVAILNCLASDLIDEVRGSLTDISNLSAKILDSLADEISEKIRSDVAQHPNASSSTLLKLAKDKNAKVRLALVENANLSEVIIQQIAETTLNQMQIKGAQDAYYDREGLIIKKIGLHPQTSSGTLQILAEEIWESSYPTNPAAEFRYWYTGNSTNIVEAVIGHHHNSIDILEKFVNYSESPTVSAIAKKNLRARLQ
jgi:hypothetical protein